MRRPNDVGHVMPTEAEVGAIAIAPTVKHSELVTALWLDEPFMSELRRIAGAWAGYRSSTLPAQEIVGDTLTDLLTGKFALAVTTELRRDVRREVRRRAKAVRRRIQAEMVALDDAPDDALLDRTKEPEPRNERMEEELLPEILKLAQDDLPVRRLLDFYEHHVLVRRTVPRRRDVLDHGMTKWIYDRARKRLRKYAEAALTARHEAAVSEQTEAADQLEAPELNLAQTTLWNAASSVKGHEHE